MALTDVQFQPHAQRVIQRALSHERLPHAYLFHGPDGVGKELLACGFAELLLCGRPVERTLDANQANTIGVEQLRTGCGECEDCNAVRRRTHPDLHVVHRRLNREHPDPAVRKRTGIELSVDVIRHFLIDAVGLTPIRGRAKVYIVREADRVTAQAQNAWLKTLEEPPNRTFIILLAGSIDRLLPTTQSRCQPVRFDTLPASFVAERLKSGRPELPAAQAPWYAVSGHGSIGQALQNLDAGLFDVNRQVVASLAQSPPTRPDALSKSWQDLAKSLSEFFAERDPEISDTEATRRALKTVLQLAAAWFGDVVRLAAGRQETIANATEAASMQLGARTFGREASLDAIRRLARAERELDLNANVQLCVDCLANDLLAAAGRGTQPIPKTKNLNA